MNKDIPSFTTPPPVVLVETWIAIVNEHDEEFGYARQRAQDILELLFGNIDVAKKYVEQHKNDDRTINVA